MGSGELKMHGLPGNRGKSGRDKEKPGQKLRPLLWRAQEPPCLLGQIEQNGGRVEDPRFTAPRPVGVDDGGDLAVRIDLTEYRQVLLALAGIDRDYFVGQGRLFQEERDLCRIGRRVEIELDHGAFLPGS